MVEELEAGNILMRSLGGEAKLNPLWQEAMREIHPDQSGITSQGVGHCLSVECNLGELISEKKEKLGNIHPIPILILSSAAALHDIAKSRFLTRKGTKKPQNHGRVGAETILDKRVSPLFFRGDNGLAKAVSYVMSPHDDGLIDKDIPEEVPLRRPPRIKIKCLAALFRLADMLDTDYSRVSYLQRLEPSNRKPKVVIARESITGWVFSKEDKRDIIIHTGKIKNGATKKILKEYVGALNESITDSQKTYLVNFTTIDSDRKEIKESFPYRFRLA
jgi:hypothetical protein